MRDFEPFRRKLGNVIMERRQKQGWSQEDLAQRAKLHRTYISDVERGERNISVESLRRLSFALAMPMWKLLKTVEDEIGEAIGSGLAEPLPASSAAGE